MKMNMIDEIFSYVKKKYGVEPDYPFSTAPEYPVLRHEEICRWIDESYAVTASKEKKQKIRPPKEWIIPANPKYYDIEHAFDGTKEINWKQGRGIRPGDMVFMYAAAPVSAMVKIDLGIVKYNFEAASGHKCR